MTSKNYFIKNRALKNVFFVLYSWVCFRVLNNLDKKQIKQRQLRGACERASAFFERSARQLGAGCGGHGPRRAAGACSTHQRRPGPAARFSIRGAPKAAKKATKATE